MSKSIIIKVRLAESKPPIWRRIVVNENTTFYKLHHIIQIAMGWDNYHLFEFRSEGYRIGELCEDFSDFGFGEAEITDSKTITLKDFITKEKEIINYEYDFGDGWAHKLTIEKIVDTETPINTPVCIKGKLCCPPEDCGGIWGFYHLLEVLADKKHKEHKDLKAWVGGSFDVDEFDIEMINEELMCIDDYINDWEKCRS